MNKRLCTPFLALSLSLLCLGRLEAEIYPLRVEISAGQIDRQQTPVCVLVEIPESLDKVVAVPFADSDLIGQLTAPGLASGQVEAAGKGMMVRELHLIVPKLAAGKTLSLKAIVSDDAPAAAPVFHWQDTAGRYSELSFDGRPTLRYMYEKLDDSSPDRRMETYKPYHHVYDPAGKRFVTKGPGGLFPHHRGLFYGFNKIRYGDGQTADVWHCRQGESQSHEKLLSQEAGPVLGRHRVAIAWRGKDGETFAEEQREMTVYNTPGGQTIDFASRLESTVGEVQLDGDPQHAGFQFRASQDVPDKTKNLTYYLRPDGQGKPGQFRNWPQDKSQVNLAWNALSFVLDDQRYTCCYLDRPQNPKEARFSERDYGRFGSYFEYTLTESNPLNLRYRIWLQKGEMTVDGVNRLSRDFINPPGVEPAVAGK
ncbi:MAG: PmoA family protein [Pirellulaceae bacterium]